MIAAGGYLELLRGAFAGHAIDQSVLSGYAPRPPSFERVLERLGLAETPERIVHPNVVDQDIDRCNDFGIIPLPMLTVL
jgi:hypothetical protein